MNASQMWDAQLVANLIAPYLDANAITHVSQSLGPRPEDARGVRPLQAIVMACCGRTWHISALSSESEDPRGLERGIQDMKAISDDDDLHRHI